MKNARLTAMWERDDVQYFKKLFSYSKQYLWINVAGSVLSVGAILIGMLIPYITKLIVDNVLIKKHFEQMTYLICAFIGAALVKSVMQYLKSYLFEYTSQKAIYEMRTKMYDKLQEQSFVFYDKARTGHLMNRMVGDLEAIRDFLCVGYIQMLEIIASIVFSFSIMITMDVRLTLIMFLIIPFLYINTMKMSRLILPKFRQIRTAFEQLTSFVQENITGIRVVKSFGMEEYEKGKFYGVASSFTSRNVEASDIRSRYIPLSQFINKLGLVIVILVGGFLVIRGNLTVGSLVAFNGYMLMLNNPLNNLNMLVNQWQNAAASSEKIFNILDQKPEITNVANPKVLYNIKGDIRFKGVYFKYNCSNVLKNINIHMKPGTVTAIMGGTGSGKSTIVNLMARFYDCSKGQILIDNTDIRDIEMNSLRKNIGIIMQETFLFSDTIAANLAFGRPDASMEEIINAAKIADAHDFIMDMPQQYETIIGERGTGLSGGQKQRIAIARAVLCNPKILVLDDATSSVDMETEQEIQRTLKSIMTYRTTLIIAHRISSVKEADEILFLDDGIVVERGTHKELIELGGKYYRTFAEQYRDYDEYTCEDGCMENLSMDMENEDYVEEYI